MTRFGDPAGFEKAWDAVVDELASVGLVLPGTVDREKERGRRIAAGYRTP